MLTRGRWTYHGDLQINGRVTGGWLLEGTAVSTRTRVSYGWWLRRHTGAKHALAWCGYCASPPYRWWRLYRCAPWSWLDSHPGRWAWSDGGPYMLAGHGTCSHQHNLADAMRVTEILYDEQTMKALASL